MMFDIKSGEHLRKMVRKGVFLVEFHARWCAPCRVQAAITARVAARTQQQAGVARMDLDRDAVLAEALRIHAIPTLILYQDGLEVRRFVGLQPEEALVAAVRHLAGGHEMGPPGRRSTPHRFGKRR